MESVQYQRPGSITSSGFELTTNMASNFDPFTQNITAHYADGSPFQVPVDKVDWWNQYCVRICINYSCQLGASIVLFVVLLLLTKSEKRVYAVFWLNSLALLSNIIRLFCEIVFFTSAFVRFYPWLTHDYSQVPRSAYATSITGVVFVLFVVVFMESSLVLQVQVVCANLRRRYRRLLLVVSVLMAMVPIGFRFTLTALNAMNIMDVEVLRPWLENTTNIIITVSICFFCIIFVVKLGFAIKMRRSLGVRDFGPMKAIFVMGCQTMVVPAILSILQYIVKVPELASNVLTLVVISLPLSSIWAGASLEHNKNRSSRVSDTHRHLLDMSSFNSNHNNTLRGKHVSSSIATTDATTSNAANAMCYAGRSPMRQQDLEAAKYGISVEHDISVQSYQMDSDV